MKELLEEIARALVDDPEQVSVAVREDEIGYILELKVAPDEVGKVIGKQGKIAKALRTVVRAAAVKEGKKVMVEIVG